MGNLNNLVVEVQGVTFQFSESSMNQQWSRFLKMRPALRDVAFDGEGARANEIDLRLPTASLFGEGVSRGLNGIISWSDSISERPRFAPSSPKCRRRAR